ncbi:hypothetical protein DFP73DRAFT_569152 [Morchella snyderi]|nr:hypothetical protein DFP73DRAFT_569152 [Morchella snyderi]
MDAVSPPPPAPLAAAAGGVTLSDGIIDNAISALQGLRTIAETQEIIAHLYPSAHQPHLGEATKLISSFIASAAELRSRCMHEQDLLVPGCIDWYTTQASGICAATPRPRELTFRLHGLARVLNELCWCSDDEGCAHSIVGQEKEDGPEVITVSVVHPGAEWDDVRRCLVAGVKAVTRMEGEVFGVVGGAVVVERWDGGVVDGEVWGREWRDLDVVDVFWPSEDEEDEDYAGDDGEYSMASGSSMASGVRDASLRSSSSKDMWGIYDEKFHVSEKKSLASVKSSVKSSPIPSLVDGGVKSEPTPPSDNSSVKPRPPPSSLDDVFKPEHTPLSVNNSVKLESAPSPKSSGRPSESIPGILKSRTSSTTKSSGSGCTVRFASTTSPPGTVQERDSHLRRRVGSASLRAPSFLSPMKDDKKSQAVTVTHPYLKRGSGMNRKSMSALK